MFYFEQNALITNGVQKNPKPKSKPKSRKNRTGNRVNRTKKKSVFQFGYGSNDLKFWLINGLLNRK